jgi:hypothetical protein
MASYGFHLQPLASPIGTDLYLCTYGTNWYREEFNLVQVQIST